MDISISGFKEEGDWDEIVDHGEEVTRVLSDHDVPEDDLEDFEEWRPKRDETLEEDITDKTAEQASVSEGKGEKEGKKPKDDLKKAGKKATESTVDLTKAGANAPKDPKDAAGNVKNSGEELQESAGYIARAVDTVSRKVIRGIENPVYRRVMTKIAPYYFDNALVSANVQKKSKPFSTTERFVFEININDDELKAEVTEELESDDSMDDNADNTDGEAT